MTSPFPDNFGAGLLKRMTINLILGAMNNIFHINIKNNFLISLNILSLNPGKALSRTAKENQGPLRVS